MVAGWSGYLVWQLGEKAREVSAARGAQVLVPRGVGWLVRVASPAPSASLHIGVTNHCTVCVCVCMCRGGIRSVGRNDFYMKVKRQEGGLFDVLLGEERQRELKTSVEDHFF